jgi:AraC-like DNA-binding protein
LLSLIDYVANSDALFKNFAYLCFMETTIHQLAIAEVRTRLKSAAAGRRFFSRNDFSIQMDADSGIMRDVLRLLRVPARLGENRIAIVISGSASWRLNLSGYEVSAPCAVLLPEGALLWIQSMSADFCCHVLAFSGKNRLQAIGTNLIKLEREDADDFEQLYHILWTLSLRYPFREEVVRSLVDAIVENCSTVASRQLAATPERHISRKEELLRQFLALVAACATQERNLSFYADRLCISVHYLCESIHDASGHYPKYWIDETLTSEAKYLLCYTDRSAAAISAELNFSNPAFFSRYFKRETGLTPGEFRLRHARV